MRISVAVCHGIETGTIQRPEQINFSEDDTEILDWVGSEQPSTAVLEAAWADFGGETAVQDGLTKELRQERYRAEADPLFFQVQRGEVEQSVYDAKVAEIRAALPLSTD